MACGTFARAVNSRSSAVQILRRTADVIVQCSSSGGRRAGQSSRSMSATRGKSKAAAGEGSQVNNFTERTTRLAERIWEALVRHRWETSKVALPSWERMDEGQRKTILSLAAEALGCPEESRPAGPQMPDDDPRSRSAKSSEA
jgi:hypothetical protein